MHMQRGQLLPNVAAGYKAVAIDMRGYCLSDHPPNVSDYSREKILPDIKSVIDQLGGGKALLCCHDWVGLALNSFGDFVNMNIEDFYEKIGRHCWLYVNRHRDCYGEEPIYWLYFHTGEYALKYPETLFGLQINNVVGPAHLFRNMTPQQFKKSSYMYFFQNRWLPGNDESFAIIRNELK